MTTEDFMENIENLIDKLMQNSKIPGLSLSIIKDNKPIYSKGFGARDLKENLPATENTLYGIGSLGKSFTTLAIMQLAEKGKLSIDDPVSKYLPFKIGIKDHPITIKHLMTHASGLPNLGVANVLIARLSFYEKETYIPLSNKDDFFRFINQAQEELIDKPEKRYFYFNAGFNLLGLIIEKVSGLNFVDYIWQNIFKPLNMIRSTYLREEFEKDNDRMVAYGFEKDKLKTLTHPFDYFVFAAGGVLTSVKEMENYALMYLNKGVFNEKKLVSEKSIENAFGQHNKMSVSLFGDTFYGFGWSISTNFFGERLIAHGGSTGASSAYIAMIPDKKIAVIVAGNVGNSQGSIIAQAILASFLGKDPMTDHPVLRMETKLSKFVGQYQSYKGISKINVTKRGGLLYVKNTEEKDSPETPLIPKTDKVNEYFFYIPFGYYNLPCEFLIDKKKNRISLVIERNVYHKTGPAQ